MIGNGNNKASTTTESKKLRVIVIGAGIGSISFLRDSFKYNDLLDITLISPNEFSETTPNIISTMLVKDDE